MTLSTIQPIGKKPETTPSMVARIDMPAGMVKMKIAIRLATISGDDGRDVRLDLAAGDQHQQRDHGHGGGDRRQHRVAERIVDVDPTFECPPHALFDCAWPAAGWHGSTWRIAEHLWRDWAPRPIARVRSQPREALLMAMSRSSAVGRHARVLMKVGTSVLHDRETIQL